jgi:transcription elongation factor GreA
MNQTQDYITKEKKAELEKELAYLQNTKRKEIAETLERARSMGDLSENAEYHQARDDQGFNEDRILQIEHVLRSAKVLDGKMKGNGISVGSVVVIKKKGDKTEKSLTIVGSEEADMLNGKISFNSPLGEALLGRGEDDEIVINTPKGEVKYNIVEVK